MHLRYLTGCVRDWPALFSEAYRCSTPGGYIESFDARAFYESDDGIVPERSALAQWGKLVDEGGIVLGQSFDAISNDMQRRGMEDAGYVVVGERDVKVGFPGGVSRYVDLPRSSGKSSGYTWLTILLDTAWHVA